MAEETERKPKIEGGEDPVINIKVKDQSGGEVVFKVKKHTKFNKIIDVFCQKKAWDQNQVRLVFEGERVQPHQTPDDLGMEDGDAIDAFIEQLGGF